ncbi:MAG TPA: DUF4037 domain-containing protein [Ktedonobacteraceae bacterium]|nr:DUF4037 domain-containing protein [Ktedonobacteraceae bacterium]
MPVFVCGLDLSRRFFREVVRPLLTPAFPNLRYAAALLGPGSEVLGFDTEMSTDHDWGPRLFLFLREEDAEQGDAIGNLLSHQLPETFADFPVSFPIPVSPKMRGMIRPLAGPVKHRIIPITLRNFLRVQLGYDLAQPLSAFDWLTFPSHALGELVAGEVYLDNVGELTALRNRFVWYPYDIWLYLLASGWQRIGQEEHLMPRAGFVGDELGSALIGSRLMRDIMNLCFLLEKQYAPYPKWFGTAFQRLHSAKELLPLLWRVQQASSWSERTEALARSYEVLARIQNALRMGRTLPVTVSLFYDRPFSVIHGEMFTQALVEQITDPTVRRIAKWRLIGNINQWSDNTDMEGVEREKLQRLYV